MTSLLLLVGCLVAFTAVASYFDWRTGLIPNALIAIGLALAIALQMLGHLSSGASSRAQLGNSVEGLLYSLSGLVAFGLGPLLLFGCHRRGGT